MYPYYTKLKMCGWFSLKKLINATNVALKHENNDFYIITNNY